MLKEDCLVLILSGGRGTRLYPLTLERSKPAIGFAGKYRLIDIPISNCINSGINKIFVLTQFLAASLHGHLLHTYQFDNFSKGFVEILAAEQSHNSFEWFHGTADAVRRVLRHLRNMPQEYVFILSSDHLYKMDYRRMLGMHLAKKAQVSVGAVAVGEDEIGRMGLLDYDRDNRLVRLIEKPRSLKGLKVKAKILRTAEGLKKNYQASMGIYLFDKNVLFEILTSSKAEDFGKDILPLLIKKNYAVYAYPFKGYWKDIGTVRSYYEASLDLLGKKPGFDIFDDKWPLFTRARFLPPNKIVNSHVVNSLLADGCQIHKSDIEDSIIGLRSKIMDGTVIKKSIIVGNDYYERRKEGRLLKPCIGRNVFIEGAIVDKNVIIGDNCRIICKENCPDKDAELYFIRDGITIIRRGAVLAPNTVI